VKVDGTEYRTIWPDDKRDSVWVIDQTRLPHAFATLQIRSSQDMVDAIRNMVVRGAPLIGAAAAYGLALAMRADPSANGLAEASARLLASRPTAVNLWWAIERLRRLLEAGVPGDRFELAWNEAAAIADEDVKINRHIGQHGLPIIQQFSSKKPGAVNVLTHCNAGWLATVDWGNALAPVYAAARSGIQIHVWVDETRPRNQRVSLTAWEPQREGVPFSVIADNTRGHLIQHGLVDLVIVGCDRVTARGDVCNKIGTYLKALAAHDNGVPFYVALPSPTIDWTASVGVREIPIEERDPAEVTHIVGADESGTVRCVRVVPEGSRAMNYAFDVTPARLVTRLITERGVVGANPAELSALM
jgi:methylthioribose-1-phosphate isomerase